MKNKLCNTLKIISAILALTIIFSTLGMTNIALADETDVLHSGTCYRISSLTSSESNVSWEIPSTNKGTFVSYTDNSSGFKFVGLNNNTVVGDSISYTLKNVPAGSYYVLVNMLCDKNCGFFDVSYNNGLNDIMLGELRERRSSGAAYSLRYNYMHMTYANLVIKTSGNTEIKLTCKQAPNPGGNAVEIGSFTLLPDNNVSRWTDELPTLQHSNDTSIDALRQQYELTWSDEFNQGKLNYNNWRLCGTAWQSDESYGTNTVAEGNVEFQNNCDGNNDGNGYLVMKQKPEPQGISSVYNENPNLNKNYDESHVDMWSRGLQSFKFGIIEMRCKLPSQNVWASFWLCGDDQEKVYDLNYNWPNSGETDIFEYIPSEQRPNGYGSALHYHEDNAGYDTSNSAAATSAGSYTHPTDLSQDFHTYGVIWTAHYMFFYCDDYIYGASDISGVNLSEFRDRANYIRITAGVRSEALGKGAITEETNWIIDYVRVYQNKNVDEANRDLDYKSYEAKKLNTNNVTSTYYGCNPSTTSQGSTSSYDIPDLTPGTYRVYAYNKSTSSQGKFKVTIGDTLLNNQVDFTSQNTCNYYKLGVVNITQSTGAKLSFTCNESGKYNIDKLIFVKADESILTEQEKSSTVTYSENYSTEYKESEVTDFVVGKSKYYPTVNYTTTVSTGENARETHYGFEQYAKFGTCEFNYITKATGLTSGDYYEMDINTLDQGIYNVALAYVGGNAPFKLQIVDESGKVTDIGSATNSSGNTIDYFEKLTWKTAQKAKLRFCATGSGTSIKTVYVAFYKSENAPTDSDKTISGYYFPSNDTNCLGYATISQYEDSKTLTAFNAKSHGYRYNDTKINALRLANARTLIYNDEFLTAKEQSNTLAYLPSGKYKLKILAVNDSTDRQTSKYGEFSFSCFELKKGTYTKISDAGTKVGTVDFANEKNYTSYSSDSARLYDVGTIELKDGDTNMIGIQFTPTGSNSTIYFFGTVLEPINEDLVLGDANDDKVFDAKDILLVKRYLAGFNVSVNFEIVDVNDDSKLNLVDLLFMKKQLAGIKMW